MAIEHLPEFNGTTPDQAVSFVAQSQPSFIPWILLVVFLSFSFTFLLGRKLNGKSDLLAALTTSAVITSVGASVLTLFTHVVNSYTIATCYVITGALGLLYHLEEKYS